MSPTTNVTMPVSALHGLLKPVLPFAGRDYMLPILCAVQLVVTPTALYAVATDRYTLGVRRLRPDAVKVDDKPFITITGDTPVQALWATTAVTDVLRLVKAARDESWHHHQVTLTITGERDRVATSLDGLTHVINDQTIAVQYTHPFDKDVVRFEHRTVSGEVPDLFKLVRQVAQREPDPDGAIKPRGLNPRYLARFQAVVEKELKVISDDPTKPIVLLADLDDGDFFGAQMPLRLHRSGGGTPGRDDLLGPWRNTNPLGTSTDAIEGDGEGAGAA